MRPSLRLSAAIGSTLLLLLLTVGVALASSNSTTLSNGANLSVSLDSPAGGTEFLADGSPVPVTVEGTASVAVGEPQATLVYGFDLSGSVSGGSFACGSVLQCEQAFFSQLNSTADASGSVNQVGLVGFGFDAVRADMTPGGGDDPLGDSADANTVINSTSLFNSDFDYRIAQYTNKEGDADGTNYTAAIQEIVNVLNASSDPFKSVIMISDGLSNAGGGGFAAAVAALHATGARVDTIAVATSCTGGTDGDLADVAGNGGTCQVVTDPNDLPNLIPDLVGSTLEKLEIAIDGGTPVQIPNADINPDLPQAGPATVSYSTQTPGLNPGSHEICVTAFGSDVLGGTADVTTCETIEVFDLTLAPASETNELGSDNEHTVTATLAGPAGAVGGYLVDFQVGGQNAGTGGDCSPNPDCTTDASGTVSFTYSVPVAPASLGDDTIEASVTLNDPTGATDTEQVAKTWEDTTPPVSECLQAANPSGNQVPPAGAGTGNSGQNPDGFYELVASDDVWPDDELSVSLTDDASSTVFGPFPVGTTIKLTQAPGATPDQRPGPGAIDWHITIQGDALVHAVDGSGNASDPVSCNVPPPPR